ncbi:MAG: hypothetical protein ACOZAM_23175 [Pseudomonadota bacterium]
MIDSLLAEAAFLGRAAWTTETAAYVTANGIDLDALNRHAGVIAIMGCHFFGNGSFEIDEEEGKPAAVIEVYAEDDETAIDVCAWPIGNPDTFATMLGADALGIARVVNPATWALGGVLSVHRTPLRWLQAGCQGCCVLDHRYVSVWLGGVPGAIQAEDIEHARQLDAWLNPPRFDRRRILIPRGGERQAA